jgi:hypothetical protein
MALPAPEAGGEAQIMNARSLHPSARNDEYADCCSAKAIVRVVMPPRRSRPRSTDLLLCGHHYRVSRQALAAASAVARGLPGTPSDIAAWLQLDRQTCPVTAN